MSNDTFAIAFKQSIGRDGATAHRQLQHDSHVHPLHHDAMMKLRTTALALTLSAVVATPAAAQDLVAHYPFDETTGTRGQRPVRATAATRRSSTATPPPSGTPAAA